MRSGGVSLPPTVMTVDSVSSANRLADGTIIESPGRTVEGERTRRHPAVEIGLKPRDPDPERLPFGNLELETEAP